MLPCGTPYSNKLGCDLRLEVTTIWDRPERNEDNKLKAVDEKPTSIVSSEEEHCDQLNWKQPKGLEEVQWSDQHQAKQKYHFEHVGQQFHKNEICNMQTKIFTRNYEQRDAIKDGQQWHV